jgi:radical SAM superfamily enzyme YgiQ (UPF0313 family)
MPRLLLVNPWNRVSLYGEYAWQPLSLGMLAAACPPGWDVQLIDEQLEGLCDFSAVDADVVGLTAFTTQAVRAYAIAAQVRAQRVPVIMGGIHASMRPQEALQFVDAVVTGEGEGILPVVLQDALHHRLRPQYDGGLVPLDGGALHPDRRIFQPGRYVYASAQTTRGCPMDCTFCSVTAFNGRQFRMRPAADVVAELAGISQRDVLLVDDDLNGFGRAAHDRCADLLRTMAEADLGKQWVTQVTINFGDDDLLPRLARQAGCAGVFIGLESTDRASLAAIRKDGRSRSRGVDYYREAIDRIHAAGLGVVGSFILGIDTQDPASIADDILRFAEDAELDALNPTILTPLPGTRDFTRLQAEGRIVFDDYPRDWERYTLAFPVTTHPAMSAAGWMKRYFQVLQYFRPEHVRALHRRTTDRVSAEAAEHAWRWNRVWTNYAIGARILRDAAPLPPSIEAAL